MITYEYDAGGNIQNKKEYWYYFGTASNIPRKTINYTYGAIPNVQLIYF